jgi:hypothetical protein
MSVIVVLEDIFIGSKFKFLDRKISMEKIEKKAQGRTSLSLSSKNYSYAGTGE